MVNETTHIATKSVTRNENGRTQSSRPHLYFWLFAAVSCIAFRVPIRNLITFSLSHDYGSHILLVAPLSVLLICLMCHEIFSGLHVGLNQKTSIAGSSLLLLALISLWASRYEPLAAENLSLQMLALVILWISGFVFFYGSESFTKARFPLLFLLLLVPFPEVVVDKAVFALQVGSLDVADGLLRLLNVPVLRNGFILQLPVINLEVARECSGIRSSIALLMTVLIAAEFGLRSPWRKVLLVIAILPILVIKNGVRIVTIYLLAAYLNPAFLHGWLHTSGGVIFYLLGLLVLIPVGAVLRRGEGKGLRPSPIHKLAHLPSA